MHLHAHLSARFKEGQHRLPEQTCPGAAQAAAEQIHVQGQHRLPEQSCPGAAQATRTDMSMGSTGCCRTETPRGRTDRLPGGQRQAVSKHAYPGVAQTGAVKTDIIHGSTHTCRTAHAAVEKRPNSWT